MALHNIQPLQGVRYYVIIIFNLDHVILKTQYTTLHLRGRWVTTSFINRMSYFVQSHYNEMSA